MAKVTRQRINDFLAGKRIAVVGVSRSEKEYSRLLFRELVKHGYEAYPVNPNAAEIDGMKCYLHLREIEPAPDRAVLLLPADSTEQAVLDCVEAGIRDIWIHRHIAGGVSGTRAIFRAEEQGLNLITGYCMFMFLPRSPWFHKLHGGLMKLAGIYPK
ncbi:MAG: CoA-binding protein [Armatimonadetes bacterium]|nr:CoA-binding protein [Armatimonadota bacterium]